MSFCNTNDIDDELHLMLVCPFQADERFLLFHEIDVEEMYSSDKEQFIKIMKNKSEKDVRYLGRFLHECLDERKHSMLDWLHISIKPVHNTSLDLLSIYLFVYMFDYLVPTVRLHVIIILLHVYLMLFLSECGSCRYCSVVVGCASRWVDFIWSYPCWACNLNGTKIWIICNDIPRSKLQDEWYPMGTMTEYYVQYIDFVLFVLLYFMWLFCCLLMYLTYGFELTLSCQ